MPKIGRSVSGSDHDWRAAGAWLLSASLCAGADSLLSSAPRPCWTRLAAPATPHRYHAAAVLDGKIYVVGGERGSAFEVYDPRTDAWQSPVQGPAPRPFLAAAAQGGTIYLLGGAGESGEPLARVDAFDVATKTWRRCADMPTARDRLASVAVGGRVLAIGGFASGRNLDVVEEYDPATNRWSAAPGLPVPRHGHAAVEVSGRVFVLGGYTTSGTVLVSPLSRVDELDPGKSAWRRRADLPHARGFFAAVRFGPYLYAMGGRIAGPAPVERYDPDTDTWTSAGAMPASRQRFAAAAADSAIIVVGGEESPATALRYDPACER